MISTVTDFFLRRSEKREEQTIQTQINKGDKKSGRTQARMWRGHDQAT